MIAAIGPLGTAEQEARPAPAVREEPRPILERGRSWFPGWRLAFGGSGLAAAAVAAFLFLRLPALPEFQMTVFGTLTSRGETEEVFLLGGKFKAEVKPEVELPGRAPLEPRCFVGSVAPAAARLRPASCKVTERDESGAMKIAGEFPASLSPGPAILWIVLSYPSHQPAVDTIEGLPTDTRTLTERWVALPQRLELRAS